MLPWVGQALLGVTTKRAKPGGTKLGGAKPKVFGYNETIEMEAYKQFNNNNFKKVMNAQRPGLKD